MSTATALVDLAAVKAKQQATWASGDFSVVGVTLQIVGEALCEAADIRGGQKVLDVAAGNGNATLAAAHRFAKVTSTDYVPSLLEKGRERARAEGLDVEFREADAENLPFADASFDAILSTYGVMFAPDHLRSAAEMARVVRPGGTIGLASWTPDGFIGEMFKTVGALVPPPKGVQSPVLWGTRQHLEKLFPGFTIRTEEKFFAFRYRSPEHFVEVFRTWYGPTVKAFAALDAGKQRDLTDLLLALCSRYNKASDGTLVAPAAYLECVLHRMV